MPIKWPVLGRFSCPAGSRAPPLQARQARRLGRSLRAGSAINPARLSGSSERGSARPPVACDSGQMPTPNHTALTKIQLRAAPVAVAFLEAPPPALERIDRAGPAGCSYWKLASEGASFFTTADD